MPKRLYNLNRIEYRNRVFTLFGLAALFLLPYFYNPFKNGIVTCAFRDWTGLPCPTCGMSRSFYLAAHFSFGESFAMHLMGPLLFLFLGLLLIGVFLEVVSNKKVVILQGKLKPQYLVVFFIGSWFIYWIYRLAGGN